MSEATPRPWRLEEDIGCIIGPDGKQVCGVRDADYVNRPNAHFVLRACNAHTALVAACEAAVPYVDYLANVGNDGAEKVDDQLRAALALARPAT